MFWLNALWCLLSLLMVCCLCSVWLKVLPIVLCDSGWIKLCFLFKMLCSLKLCAPMCCDENKKHKRKYSLLWWDKQILKIHKSNVFFLDVISNQFVWTGPFFVILVGGSNCELLVDFDIFTSLSHWWMFWARPGDYRTKNRQLGFKNSEGLKDWILGFPGQKGPKLLFLGPGLAFKTLNFVN